MSVAGGGAPSIGRLQLRRASGSVGLGRYRVFASLGRGGMADVQLAAAQGPKGFHKLVVVKRLRPLLAEDAAVVNMFLDEARLDARLNHPNLVHTYEFGEENGTYFIVMEFLEGQPLHEILHATRTARSRAPVSPCVWAKIVAEALAGLHHAHELRDYDGTPLDVVHRDVSPQNIVVTYDGGVKLVDFGIAKATLNATKTESQIIKGKLAYMAPEQADLPEGETVDRRADVFAMGIVLWECLARRRLATGDDARAIVSKIMNLEFQAPSTLNPDVPPELDAITRRALQHAPADRYPTALAMREALERFLRTHGDLVDETTIGALLTGLFAREREDIQRQIRVQMLELGTTQDLTVADSTPSQRIARAAEDAVPPPDLPRVGAPASNAESVGSLRAVRTSVTSESRGSPGRRLAVAAAVLALAGGTVLATRHSPPAARGADAVAVPPIPLGAASPSTTGAAPEVRAAETPTIDSGAAAASIPAPSASGGTRLPGVSLPSRAAAPRAGAQPPKLDADPWR